MAAASGRDEAMQMDQPCGNGWSSNPSDAKNGGSNFQWAQNDSSSIGDASMRSDIVTNWSVESVSTSLWGYEYENGRRYHSYKAGAYWGPNDEKQNSHLDILHHVSRLCLDGELFISPIQSPKRILDLGTGTGVWAMDCADMFPNAQVTGVDLSPTQPQWLPPNCKFETDDIDIRWVHPINHYSFIHGRFLLGCISDWNDFIDEIYSHLEPGGWVELTDVGLPWHSDDGSLHENTMTAQWLALNDQAAERMGKSLNVGKHLKTWLQMKGLKNVSERICRVPVGPYEEDRKLNALGNANLASMIDGIEGMSMAFYTRYLGWEREEVKKFIEQVQQELMSGNIRCYFNIHFVCGQKPLDSDHLSQNAYSVDSLDTESIRSQMEYFSVNAGSG